MGTLILVGLIALFLSVGGGLMWHSIGTSAVAKHEQQVQAEQDKVDAVAKVKTEEAAKALIDMQAAFEAGQSEAQVIEKKVYIKGQDFVRETTVFRNKDCVVPAAGMAILNGARGELQDSTVADILGIPAQPQPATSVRIIEVPRPVVPPEQATKPQTTTRPPKPVPVVPK